MARTGIGVTLRAMTSADVEAVAALELASFPQPWSAELFADEIARPNRRYVVALEADGTVVGYGGVMLVEEDGHVTTIAVDELARGRGVGGRLLLWLVEEALAAGARHLTLEVRHSNLAARSLYERFGFAPIGLRKNYYQDEDALIMWAIDIDQPEYRRRLDELRRSIG